MQINKKMGLSFSGSVESALLEDAVVLVDSAGVALGVQRPCSARLHRDCDDDSGVIAFRRVEIPVIGSDGEVSGILYRYDGPSNSHDAVASGDRERVRAIADTPQFVVHDINNLLAVIGSGLRLLERQSDAGRQKAIIGRMQEAITRGALLIRQLLDSSRSQPKSIDGFVSGSRLLTIAGTLNRTVRPDITVHTEIADDLWAFNAHPEELYFALLNLCRNSADAMPNGGVITIAARNVEPSAGVTRGHVEIVIADHGEGMPEEVLSRALNPYFTTKPAGSGTGLGLAQVQRFAEERGGTVSIESVRNVGTLVRLLLPRVQAVGLPISIVGR